MSDLSDRPDNAVVGVTMEHESAALHVTGHALYTDDLVGRSQHVLHAHPVQAPHAHAASPGSTRARRTTCPAWCAVLTADDVPGVNDAGIKHDEPLFPDEVMYHGHAVCWVLGETLEAARRGAAAVEVDYEPLPAIMTVRRGDRGDELPGDAAACWSAATPRPAWPGRRHVFEGEIDFAGQEHFYLETHCVAGDGRRGRPGVRAVQHPAPDRDAGDRRPRARRAEPPRSPCSACGWAAGSAARRCSPTGSPRSPRSGATLTGRPVRVRLTRQQDITMTGKRHGFHASWRVGFDDDGRILALEATLTSDGGWSLDLSEPVLSRALCHVDNAYWIPAHPRARPDRARPTRPRRRPSAGSAGRRGCS